MQNGKPLASFRAGETIAMPFEFEAFRQLTIVEHYSSHNRMVARVTANGNGHEEFVLKVMGEKTPLAPCDIDAIKSDIKRYRLDLATHQIRMPAKPFLEQIEICGRHYLIEITPYCGESLERRLLSAETSDSKALGLAMLGLDQLRETFRRSRERFLPVGIDMVPRNFAVSGDDIYYVDLVPAKIWRIPLQQLSEKAEDQIWQYTTLEFPEVTDRVAGKIGFKRHFTKHGVLIVWLTQLSLLRPTLYHQFRAVIEHWLDAINDHATLDRFQSRRMHQILQPDQSVQLPSLVATSTPADVYFLREAACFLAAQSDLADTPTVFTLTHFQHEPPCPQKVAQTKALLLNRIAPQPHSQEQSAANVAL